jgi:hypothetical protein
MITYTRFYFVLFPKDRASISIIAQAAWQNQDIFKQFTESFPHILVLEARDDDSQQCRRDRSN